MAYEIPNLRDALEIRTALEEFITRGYRPVYREALTFSTGTDDYDLTCEGQSIKKVYDILLITGEKDGIEHTFVSGTDYTIKDSDLDGYYDQITWNLAGDDPDDDTTFYVDYRYIGTASKLTDISDSSVISMILDAVASEVALLELKMNETAKDSFIDTADGVELDELGKIAGVNRNQATQSTGYVTMSRPASMTTGLVDIPVGTQVSTEGSTTQAAIVFETTAAAQITDGVTDAKVSDASHQDYDKTWIPIQSIYPGSFTNVSSNTITKNVSANTIITTITNTSEFDTSNEQVVGTGTAQVFTLNHIATAAGFVDKDADSKAIEIRAEDVRGWMAQPASAGKVKFTLSTTWTGTATIVGYSASDGDNVSDTVTFTASSIETSTNIDFTYIYYITFSGPSGGLDTVDARIQCPAAGAYIVGSSTGQLVDDRVDSGFTALHSVDDTYDAVYIYDSGAWGSDDISNWARNSVNIGEYARTHYSYTPGLASWESTYGSDGTRKLRFEYVPSATCGTSSIAQYTADGDGLEVLWALVDGSYLEVDYRWLNTFTTGSNTESDDDYRERIKTGLTASAKGTKAAILATVLGVDGIAGATVSDYADDSSIAIGECDVFAWTSGGTLTAAKRSEVIAAIEDVRPAGIQMVVSSPDPIYIAVELAVKVPQDQGYTLASVKAASEAAISAWISAHTVGQDMLESDLIGAMDEVVGVSYVDVTSLKVKGFENVTDDGTSPSTREPNTGGWSWTTGWNVITVNSGDIVRPDTDDTGSGTVRFIAVTAEFE